MNQTSTDPGELSNSYETIETISKYRKNMIREENYKKCTKKTKAPAKNHVIKHLKQQIKASTN